MSYPALKRRLVAAMAGPLPGIAGQTRLAPRPRIGWRPEVTPDGCRHGGGLLLVYPRSDAAHVALTLREEGLQNHAGQVSLPGGAVEEGESLDRAALREAEEEIGVDPREVRLLGALSPLHVPVSQFVLHPWVGVAERRPEFRPDATEVARILEVPLAELADPSRLAVETRRYSDQDVRVPFFRVEGEKVWGATAMVLAEFLDLLGAPPDPWRRDYGRP